MKSKFLSLCVITLLCLPFFFVNAADFRPLVGIPGLENTDIATLGFGDYINALYRLSISIAALLAVIKIIAAGVKYMFSDIVTQKADAKKDIQGALVGLLIIIGAVIILNTVNTDITKSQIDIKPLTNADGTPISDKADFATAYTKLLKKIKESNATCQEKYKEHCKAQASATKEWCQAHKGDYVAGVFNGGFNLNAQSYCYYDDQVIPSTGIILKANQQEFICTGTGSLSGCTTAESDCKTSGGKVAPDDDNPASIICEGPISCPATQIIKSTPNKINTCELDIESAKQKYCSGGPATYTCELTPCGDTSYFDLSTCTTWCSVNAGNSEYSSEYNTCYYYGTR